jgi:hypothetical protein
MEPSNQHDRVRGLAHPFLFKTGPLNFQKRIQRLINPLKIEASNNPKKIQSGDKVLKTN